MGALIYIGDGSVWFQNGQPVPNRDLTENEVKLYGGKRALLKSGLYAAPPKQEIEIQEVNDGSIE